MAPGKLQAPVRRCGPPPVWPLDRSRSRLRANTLSSASRRPTRDGPNPRDPARRNSVETIAQRAVPQRTSHRRRSASTVTRHRQLRVPGVEFRSTAKRSRQLAASRPDDTDATPKKIRFHVEQRPIQKTPGSSAPPEMSACDPGSKTGPPESAAATSSKRCTAPVATRFPPTRHSRQPQAMPRPTLLHDGKDMARRRAADARAPPVDRLRNDRACDSTWSASRTGSSSCPIRANQHIHA